VGATDTERRTRRPRPEWLLDLERVDVAVYAAIASTPTPALDRTMRRLTRAADNAQLSLGASALLVLTRGRRGLRAAGSGLASVAVTATIVNVAIKPLAGRRRPDPAAQQVPVARLARMPRHPSFPSGHTASAFAFASGVSHVLPREALPLYALATVVAYSRVHTGVHFPADVVAGSVLGSALGGITAHRLARRRSQ
jgi:membrane-associated phospholipid phosphatase